MTTYIHVNQKNTIMELDDIAQQEFGMDYCQLGTMEQEWCRLEWGN